MMLFTEPIAFAPREYRADSDYTSRRVGEIEALATGGAGEVAICEAALSLWERGLASGQSAALSRSQLARIGRSLLLKGESVWPVHMGRLQPGAASTVNVRGQSSDPAGWQYTLSIPAPTAMRTLRRSGADVAHFRIGTLPEYPWRGSSPLANAGVTVGILRRLEASLSHEAGAPTGNVLPVPAASAADTQLASDLQDIKGRTVLVETTAGGHGEGRAAAPASDWESRRLGPQFTPTEPVVRESAERSILAAAGVPPALVQHVTGSDAREAWRRFLHSTIAPLAALIVEELARVGIETEIDLGGLNASDLTGRARAYRSLRDAGMDDTEARRIVGF